MRRVALCVVIAACAKYPTQPAPTALTVTINSPAPGDELLAADAPMITVTGSVTSSSPRYGVTLAWVNGTPVDLDASGNFSAQIAPQVGVNHIEVDGGDGFGDLASKQLDVLWAPDYLPPAAGTTSFSVPDALDLYLGQRFFDGRLLGTTLDMSTTPNVVAHDLAAALELILWNVDLATLLHGAINAGTGSSQLSITIPQVSPAEILVDAQISDTPTKQIDLSIDLNGVFLGTTGTFQYAGKTLQVAGGLSADMHASVTLQIGALPDGSILVVAANTTAVVGPLVPMFTGPDANTLDGFIEVGNNDFRLLVQNIIQQNLIPTFTNKLPPLLESLLGATDKLLHNLTFTLDAQLGNPVMVTLDGKVAALDAVTGPPIGIAPGHVTVRQTVAIGTQSAPIHASSRGAARVSATPTLPPTDVAALDVLMSEDFFNALLHSLWNSGLLEGNAMVGGLSAGVSAKLAPFVIPTPDDSPCEIDGVRCDVVVQLGQIELTLPDFSQSFAISASAGARVVVSGTTVSLVIQQTPQLVVWETSDVPGRLSTAAVSEIVTSVVWPQLFGAIGDKLHITLPIPDLAALGLTSLSPNLANAQLQLAVRSHAGVTAGFLGLGADIQLQTPHP